MTTSELLQTAIKDAGGPVAVAGRMQCSAQRLLNWVKRGVPFDQCVALETALGGRVTRKQMRPDDWHKVWPAETTPEPANA